MKRTPIKDGENRKEILHDSDRDWVTVYIDDLNNNYNQETENQKFISFVHKYSELYSNRIVDIFLGEKLWNLNELYIYKQICLIAIYL